VTNRLDDRSGRPAGLEYVLELWMRRKWVALLVFAGAFAVVASLAVWLPDLYRATATVLVETQHVSEELVRSSVSAELETRIETIRQEVMSRARLADLVARFDLYPDLRKKGVALDALIERMRRDIELELNGVAQQMSGRGPTIAFAISYSGRNPQTVARVANELASFYVEENSKIREGQAVRTAEFLKAQLADVKKDLDAREQRVSEFNLSHIGELPQQVAANLASLERLNTQLRLNGDDQVRAMDRRERLERQLADAESVGPGGDRRERLDMAHADGGPGATAAGLATASNAEQLARLNLRRQLDELRRKFTDHYPDVIRVQTELANLERQLSERAVPAGAAAPAAIVAAPLADPTTRLAQAIADASAELKALKKEELALKQAVNSYEQRVENVPKRQEESQALSRDYETTKERYDTLLKRSEEAQLAASLEQGQKVQQFRILDSAIPPREPAAPNRLRLFAIGFVLALGLAVGAVVLAEKLDTAFHSLDDLRAFVTVPTLFSIPLILTPADARQQRRRLALTTVSIVLGLALIVTGSRYLAAGNEQIVRLTARGHV
jgi:succinoglycan biosynthesis transport protein ExoP